MPTQYPTLSGTEQTVRWKKMAGHNLFPYSYRQSAVVDTNNFSRVAANSFQYLTIPFQADNNSAISILEVASAIIPSTGFGTTDDHRGIFNIQVSYAPDMITDVNAYSATVLPQAPIDNGNIIYNVFDSYRTDLNTGGLPSNALSGVPENFNHYHRFEPFNYLAKFNQIIYIHIGFLSDTHTITGAGVLTTTCIFHMLNTGLKS